MAHRRGRLGRVVLMSVGMVAFWAFVIYGVVWLARTASPAPVTRSGPASGQSPEEVLKHRLARGDITVEDYERLRAAIEDDPSSRRERTAGEARASEHAHLT